jgi:hypothetical protein
MRFGPIAALTLLSACSFDTAVPDTALIHCAENSECPTGWKCSSLRGICQKRNESDSQAPTLTGTVSPSVVRPGERIAVTLESDEPLSGTAIVEVRTGSSLRKVEATGDGFSFTVPGDEPDGLLSFYARAEDLAGNGTQGVSLGTTLVDGTLPSVTSARVTPSVVAPNGSVSVAVTVSEEVRAGARLRVLDAKGVELSRSESTAAASALRYELTVPAGTADQALSLSLENLIDLAGNPGATSALPAITVDGTAPTVGALGLSGRRYSAQPGFDEVVVQVAVTNAQSVQVCVGSECSDGLGQPSVRFGVKAGIDGPRLVSVRARDAVGNLAEATDLVTFDFTPPTVQSVQVKPSAVAPGSTVAVTATFDELLKQGAQLTARGPDGGVVITATALNASDRVANFDFTVPSSLDSQQLRLAVTAIADTVDNAAGTVDGGVLDVDSVPPTVGALGLAGRTFSRQSGFNDVAVPVVVTDAKQIDVCVAGTCVSSAPGTTEHFSVGSLDTPGPKTVSVRAIDAVGHVTEVVESVTYDFSAPVLQSLQITPNLIGPGGTVAVTATFDEPLAAGTALAVTGADGGYFNRFFSTISAARLATFNVRLPQTGLPSQTFALRLEAIADEVANAAGSLDAGAFVLDSDPPQFTGAGSDTDYARTYSHVPGYDVVSVPTPETTGATRTEICLDQTCQDVADGAQAEFAVEPNALEGTHQLITRAFDEVGNVATRFGAVTYDFTAPAVLTADVRYVPPAGCPLQLVNALTRGSGAVLELTASEPLFNPPDLDSGVLSFRLIVGDGGVQTFAWSATGPASLNSGAVPIGAALVDLVGNAATRAVTTVIADTAAPPALTAAQEDLFSYNRNPFGTITTSYAPRFLLRADAGTFEPGAQVQVWSTNNVATGLLVAAITADSQGALPLTTLLPVDLPKLYFRTYDSACNVQPATGLNPVPRMEYVATLGTKVAGQSAPNPHRFVEEAAAEPATASLTALREWGGTDVGKVDGTNANSLGPTLRWQRSRLTTTEARCVIREQSSGQLYALGSRAWRWSTLGWVDEGPLPIPVNGSCINAFAFGSTRIVAAASGGLLVHGASLDGGAWTLAGNVYFEEPGFLAPTITNGAFYVTSTFYDPTTVYEADSSLNLTELPADSVMPGRYLEPRNVATFGGGPFVVGNSSDSNLETWSYVNDGSTGWVQLANAPEAPAMLVSLFYPDRVLLLSRSSQNAWAYDTQWHTVPPCPIPQPYLGAYTDSSGHAVVVSQSSAIATFDGTNWTIDQTPRPDPSGVRIAGYTAADGTLATQLAPATNRLIYHGSFSDAGQPATWQWNGNTWSQSAATNPVCERCVAATESDGGVVLHGLTSAGAPGTFRFRNGAWLRQDAGQPTVRHEHAMARDRLGQMMVLGGLPLPPDNQPLSAFFIEYSGFGWSNGPTLPSWSRRARHAMAFDPSRGVTVLFGGTDGTTALSDTWEYTSLWYAPTLSGPQPTARLNPSLVYDPVRQQLVLTGGTGTSDTWIYGSTGWTDLTLQTGSPPGAGLAAWDPTLNAIFSMSPQGEAWLAPHLPVAHRFILSGVTQPGMVVLSGRAVSSVVTSPANLAEYFVWSGTAWQSYGPATLSPVSFDASTTSRILTNGLRISPPTMSSVRLDSNYVELTVRQRVTN